ncbi:MAG: hypothetical protein A3I07_02405 [Candidatus Doudnabacteria bacterium RIFCSPLOWO2_02_FULL_42_9]|uniref:Bacterial type II secretion system protein E domain-containing protein n=1 Tax=Candidatus Doudnabacteria bacterium RIFCSPHIGHO2_01_FULL_41_86 TaxID=1817821 RepID=A0A1F5N7G0_9BACT|nr:MAG: hypothetical protein A2717_03115 [Candidatus Doudnabacteria bacterium RIFCSPHIGHO2_01_FULL_41_86]OGE74685.1 MAG: hypothetical protein A3K07_02710 [Candidatus Doudnabacteria bacterium RIFCSPHIGHO2_01_43_10]OGE85044.1 MAG: hypothetical protein A3E28_04520 [Candidatus Doudnabacteria bacterium RIFCSPHIGHO2_12_FULL_42_22]OGE86485.1 MAG: hypothetical protein A3C49_04700 [Candidatus Doudnabacteria bacterium RIFCSPHIGHO2_02_FULL_42_25]OGE91947.1 MAG: hypothetical protein A2895_01465 [Candidatus
MITDKGQKVKQIYSDLNRKFEEEETKDKAKEQSIAYMNLYGFPADTQILNLLPREMAESYECIIFSKDGKHVKLGSVKLGDHLKPVLKHLTGQNLEVELFLISKSSFEHFLDNYNRLVSKRQVDNSIKLMSSDSRLTVASIKKLSNQLSDLSASDIIEILVGTAFNINASDIHLEPGRDEFKVRFRVDGILQDVTSLNIKSYPQLVSRIKIMSKVKLNVTNVTQDGSFSLQFNGQPADIRTSVLPSAFGESIVMRLLRQDQSSMQFEELGIRGLAKERILESLQKSNGMILSTGPTGSGKTTTLYAILNKLIKPGVKIITLEDPVEYKIEGITQTPIDPRSGMTFGSALQGILRQDPDIVMVGEMRDLETAETAMQAALTGHVVLSTLHTNDAAAAIPRLLDIGVRGFVLAPALSVVIAQRLVRRLCTFCKQQTALPANLQSRVETILQAIPKKSKVDLPKKLIFYHSPGCEKCHGLGYSGRTGIYEVLVVNEGIQKLINDSATSLDIKKQAVVDGMLTKAQDGLLKALEGITDVEEVFRVTEE